MSRVRTNWARSNTAGKFESDEINTHQSWIDGKQIYRKVIDVGDYPNATLKSVGHDVRNIDTVIMLYGHGKNTQYQKVFPNPSCDIYIENAVLHINATADFSSYEGNIIMEYTKNE